MVRQDLSGKRQYIAFGQSLIVLMTGPGFLKPPYSVYPLFSPGTEEQAERDCVI